MERKFEKRDLSGLMSNNERQQQERDSSPNPRGTLQTATGQYKLQTTQDQKVDFNWDEEDDWEPQTTELAANAPWAPKQTPKTNLGSAIGSFKPQAREPQKDGLERFRAQRIDKTMGSGVPDEWKRRGSDGRQTLRPLGRLGAAASTPAPAPAPASASTTTTASASVPVAASATPATPAAPAAAAAAAAPAAPTQTPEEAAAAQKKIMAEARARVALARAAELEKEERDRKERLAAKLAELERRTQPAVERAERPRGERAERGERGAPRAQAVDQDWSANKKKGKGPLQSMKRNKHEHEPYNGDSHKGHDDSHEHDEPKHPEHHLQKVIVALPRDYLFKEGCNPKELLKDLSHCPPAYLNEQRPSLPVRVQLPVIR